MAENLTRMLKTSVTIKRALLLICAAALCTHSAGCKSKGAAAQQRYELKGKAVHVDKRGGTVTIAHEAIPGYMEAMTMPFKLKDEWAFDELAAGDRVTATLVVEGDRSWIENIVFVREGVDPQGASSIKDSIEPQQGDAVPDFTLTNQDGKRIRLRQYRGRALLLTFIYTRCPLPDYCPLMTENFAEVENALKADPALYAKTHLLSVTVDPEYDTPKVLREYGAAYGVGESSFKHWEFATGSSEEIKKAATYFGLSYWQDKDQIVHSLRTAIISPDGKLFKLYNGNEWKPAQILSGLQSLSQSGPDRENGDASNQAQPSKQSSVGIHNGIGTVESVDKVAETVQINHEDIKDYMPAMSMPFRVKEKSLLDSVAPGDRVEFSLQDTPSGMVVVAIRKVLAGKN